MLGHTTRPVGIDVLRSYMRQLLEAVGFDHEAAATVADVHVESDLRGVGVQGFNHLINSHLQEYMSGKADPTARPEIVKERACFALVDGNSGPGPLAALMAADVAATKARQAGCAVVGVRNSHDLFHAGLYAERMANRDVIGMVFTDDVVPVVHPVGGVEPIIGSNPMAMSVPTASVPFLADFTPCSTLPTYVRYSRRYDGELPDGVAHDRDGLPTTDPNQVCDGLDYRRDIGAIDPGGHKGYGLLLMIDFLSGALVGCEMGTDHVDKEGARKGHLFIAIDPEIFGGIDDFKRSVSGRLGAIKRSKMAPGVGEIRYPGEGSAERRRRALSSGEVQIDCHCWEDGLKIGERLGVEPASNPDAA